jgi:hypothetical protein
VELEEEEDDDAFFLITTLALMGKHSPIWSIQTYLTCKDLPGHPRFCSTWTHMREVGNNQAFITVMGIDLATFESILVPFNLAWSSSTIPRANVTPVGKPQPHRRSLDAAGGLALIFHWLSSTMAVYMLQQLFSITAAVCLQDLLHARQCLLTVLKDLRITHITWPSSDHQNANVSATWSSRNFSFLLAALGLLIGWIYLSLLLTMRSEFLFHLHVQVESFWHEIVCFQATECLLQWMDVFSLL